MKILICGPARHGKDTVADILREHYGFRHESSSMFALRRFIRDQLASEYGLVYTSDHECYEDRVNHRKKWYDLICAYNSEDRARLARELLEYADIYVGIRDMPEFHAARSLFDITIWVDARGRVPVAGEEEFADRIVKESDCDITILNDGTIEDLERKVHVVFGRIPCRAVL